MARHGEANALLLEEQVCFALYAASRAMTDVYRPILDRLDLTYPQYLVMLVLWERDRSTVREIGATLALDYGTVSPLLKRLERRGVLARRRSAADERIVEVALTAQGRELRAQAESIPAQVGCAVGMDRAQRRTLISALNTVTEAARRYHGTADDPVTG